MGTENRPAISALELEPSTSPAASLRNVTVRNEACRFENLDFEVPRV